MLKCFYPGAYLDSAYELPYERLYEKGYRGIIFDVDNTLVPHGAPADQKALELFERLRGIGFSTCILSNNKEPRVKPFADSVKSPYLYKGGKPKRRGYVKAMERMGTSREQTLFVGDQLFTDVWGANRSGIFSVLTKPIDPREEIQIVLKRCPEAVVLFFYQRWRQNDKKQLKSNEL
ncbi:MAG: YqeG family HAD IIIA-type phosphatase [Lachnospiraceae bacterium]|jgi:HAD superfamily phosphatase (TIGR01668 family)|nr:YqeG family HAD IIIA-type phosphatase [Lachnospiraceae bacterium]